MIPGWSTIPVAWRKLKKWLSTFACILHLPFFYILHGKKYNGMFMYTTCKKAAMHHKLRLTFALSNLKRIILLKDLMDGTEANVAVEGNDFCGLGLTRKLAKRLIPKKAAPRIRNVLHHVVNKELICMFS